MEPPQPPRRGKVLRPNRTRARKKFTHVKRHVEAKPVTPAVNQNTSGGSTPTGNLEDFTSEHESSRSNPIDMQPSSPNPSVTSNSSSISMDHDYCSRPSSSISLSEFSEDISMDTDMSSLLSPTSSQPPSPWILPTEKGSVPESPPPPALTKSQQDLQSLLLQARNSLFLMLPMNFVILVDNEALHVLMIGRREEKATQRQVTVYPSGDVKIQVHGEYLPSATVDSMLKSVRSKQPLSKTNIGYFGDRVTDIVEKLRLYEICAGSDQKEFKEAWAECSKFGRVDNDIYKECRYAETFRSKKCVLLVEPKNWRCKECSKLLPVLKRKIQAMQCEEPHENTNVRYMVSKQKDKVISKKQKKIKLQKQTIDRLQQKMRLMIEKEGQAVDSNLSKDFTDVLLGADLNANQSLFLQQQIQYAKCKKKTSMKWHPTLIRMALSLYLKAPGAYKELCDSGFVKLPTSRTLFDYSHVTEIKSGIDSSIVETVQKQSQSNGEKQNQKQYHVIMCDEMHISKNLVRLKSTGELIGFTDLDELDQEIASLQAHLDDPDKPLSKELASKVFVYMVKGVSSNLKYVIASYPVVNVSPKQMYVWTWEVIGALERSGVMVIAFVCDGAATNRAFIKLNRPATPTISGVVFDTVNKHAPDRLIYFFSDVPHLLKTIRNAFYNSRKKTKNNKKSPRLLKKNGQYIVWDSIIRLYLAKKDKVLRKSYKLNAQNVYPDSYTRMKVRPAAEVLSHTVGSDLASQQWEGTSETVEFIFKVNDWFDLLNGAFSGHGKKKNNMRLNPYVIKDVVDFENGTEGSRFQQIFDFLEYLDAWKKEITEKINASQAQSIMDDLGVEMLPDEGSFHSLNDSQAQECEEGEDASSRNLLPHQTLHGIEMSCRAFVACTKFLLSEGISFINARAFCQDPLEQNFGRQRMAGGGSNNPNMYQFLHKQRNFSTIGELSAANKRGNTEVLEENIGECSSEPLPKRRAMRKKKLDV